MEVYISPTETHCVNIDYHIPEDKESAQFSEDLKARLRKSRILKCEIKNFDSVGSHTNVGDE